MARLKLFKIIIISISCLIPLIHGLTDEEERRLILQHDSSIIEEKLRELPGGILLPPDPITSQDLPVPTMDPELPKIQFDKVASTPQVSQVRVRPVIDRERIRSVMKSMKDRLHPLKPLSSHNTYSTRRLSKQSSLITTPVSNLEIALKRIEILASRAGFNMSSVPRRTQLQIVTKLADKLPTKLSDSVKTSLRSNDVRIYDFLPEPSRDPNIEDRPDMLSTFVSKEDDFDFDNDFKNDFRSGSFDSSRVSITSDGSLPELAYDTELASAGSENIDLELSVVPPTNKKRPESNYFKNVKDVNIRQFEDKERYIKDVQPRAEKLVSRETISSGIEKINDSNKKNVAASENISKPVVTKEQSGASVVGLKDEDRESTIEKETEAIVNKKMETWTKPKRVSIEKPEKKNVELDSNAEDILREAKSLSSSKPIRVSIISKDAIATTTTTTTTTTEPSTSSRTTTTTERVEEIPEESKVLTKYVHVSPLREKHNESLLFQLEKDIEDGPPTDYDDLTEEEITAMVEELRRYEAENYNSVEFDYSRLVPHPLEFPDHPEHPRPDSIESDFAEIMKAAGSAVKPTAASSSSSATSTTSTTQATRLQNGEFRPFSKPRPFPYGGPLRYPPQHPFGAGRPHPHPMMLMHPRKPHHPPPRPLLQKPPGPMRINDVKVSEIPKNFNKECDYFSNELCLLVQDYPIEAISEAIERNPELALSLLPRENNENSVQEDNVKLQSEGGFLCPSKVAYGKIKKAKSSTDGKWKYVVNYGDKTQTLRIEKCLTPGDRCSYVMPHYRTACTQVYNYHRLLAWEPDVGLHVDVFKVPTCCTCHVQGYYMAPKNNVQPQSPASMMSRRRISNHPGSMYSRFHHRLRMDNNMPAPTTSKPVMTTTTTTTAKPEETEDLNDLLKQYSALRDKIHKKKSTNSTLTTSKRSDRMLKNLDLIETVLLRKKKRSNGNLGNLKKRTDIKKLLKSLKLKNSKLSKTQLLAIAKRQISKNVASKQRQARNLRQVKSNKSSKVNKRQRLAWLLKQLKSKNGRKSSKNVKIVNIDDKVNYSYHPIMDYYNRVNNAG